MGDVGGTGTPSMDIFKVIGPDGKVLKSLYSSEFGNIDMDLPILKSKKNTTKKSLIFSLFLITYVVAFFVLRKFKL